MKRKLPKGTPKGYLMHRDELGEIVIMEYMVRDHAVRSHRQAICYAAVERSKKIFNYF